MKTLAPVPAGSDQVAIGVRAVRDRAPSGSALSPALAAVGLCRDGSAKAPARCFADAGLDRVRLRTASEVHELRLGGGEVWRLSCPGIVGVNRCHPVRPRAGPQDHYSGACAAIVFRHGLISEPAVLTREGRTSVSTAS